MRKQFLDNLEQYGDLAKRAADTDNEQAGKVEEELFDLIGEVAKDRGTPARTQGDIYHIQEKKQEIMNRLKEQVRDLDYPEYRPEMSPQARFIRAENGKYLDQQGGEVSLGELMTDGEWGIEYYLDPQTMPRPVRKRFLVERARQELNDYLDQQIIKNEIARQNIDEFKRAAYLGIMRDREPGQRSGGHIAELMVRNFLQKLCHDFPGLDFEVQRADVYQDVEQKIDFIISRRPHLRGVSVDVPSGTETKGIQFTTNLRQDNIQRKKGQIAGVRSRLSEQDQINDIVLVSIPLSDFMPVYNQWKQTKNSGGPDKLWPPEVKEKIFQNIMQGLFTPEEIKQQWQRVSGDDH